MKKILSEFKAFALKGNVVDLAVAVVVGGAFGKIVTALVQDLIMPIVGFLQPGKGEWRDWGVPLNDSDKLRLGHLFAEILDFTIVAFVLFVVTVKVMGALRKKPEAAPATKTCPECLETIALAAKRCKHCTAVQPEAAK